VRERPRKRLETVLLDTNVLIDAILSRSPWGVEAALVLTTIERGDLRGAVSVHALATLDYFARKELGGPGAQDAIAKLVSFVEVAPIGSADVQFALSLSIGDFEDALHIAAAHSARADAIITHDASGFRQSPIPALSPGALLAVLREG
jgi:predicted nucleic acid-binding protein